MVILWTCMSEGEGMGLERDGIRGRGERVVSCDGEGTREAWYLLGQILRRREGPIGGIMRRMTLRRRGRIVRSTWASMCVFG